MQGGTDEAIEDVDTGDGVVVLEAVFATGDAKTGHIVVIIKDVEPLDANSGGEARYDLDVTTMVEGILRIVACQNGSRQTRQLRAEPEHEGRGALVWPDEFTSLAGPSLGRRNGKHPSFSLHKKDVIFSSGL